MLWEKLYSVMTAKNYTFGYNQKTGPCVSALWYPGTPFPMLAKINALVLVNRNTSICTICSYVHVSLHVHILPALSQLE